MNVYLDTETTGFSAANGDTIVEIAIVDHNGRPLIDTLVNPQRAIPWQATKVHGIRDDMVRGKPTLGQMVNSSGRCNILMQEVLYGSTTRMDCKASWARTDAFAGPTGC